MSRRRAISEAERRRRHRQELELALREELTLDEARAKLRSYELHQPRLDADDRAPARLVSAPPPARPTLWYQDPDR